MRLLASLVAVSLLARVPAMASPRMYLVPSPTHGQTYALGSERHQQWLTRGPDRHLALAAEFTNDPYVDRTFPRQYDDFTFDFPDIRLGADQRTFYYHPPNGHAVPVAERHPGILGLEEIALLPGNQLLINAPHGYLSLFLLIGNRSAETASL